MSTQANGVAARMEATLTRHKLLRGVKRLGVAVSGGADSTALLRLLAPFCRERKIELVALHLDHGLRGAASAADARFVKKLAEKRSVRFLTSCAENLEISGKSLEMAAREARQQFFQQAAKAHKLDVIATGHTADDVAETLLLRLARGGGATGLAGLRPRHAVEGVTYIRPLLDCSHVELCAWLRKSRQPWREDASNGDEDIPRNFVRHQVLPWMEREWRADIRPRLAQSAAILRDEDALLDELARPVAATRTPDELRIKKPERVSVALMRRVIRNWLMDVGHADATGWETVERLRAMMEQGTAWRMTLPGDVQASGKGGVVRLARAKKITKQQETRVISIPGVVCVAGVRVAARRARGIVRTIGLVGALPSACTLDAAALRGRTLVVRTRQSGDRIRPLGLNGSKSVQDLLVDAKVPQAQRDRLPLLVVDDEIVWVPGYRVAQKFAVCGPRAASVRIEMKREGRKS
jgi:tRNA(Ile)-lysidine synthase